jgi:hypothetical protein
MIAVAVMQHLPVIPAKAGIQCLSGAAEKQRRWIPAFAGMTSKKKNGKVQV